MSMKDAPEIEDIKPSLNSSPAGQLSNSIIIESRDEDDIAEELYEKINRMKHAEEHLKHEISTLSHERDHYKHLYEDALKKLQTLRECDANGMQARLEKAKDKKWDIDRKSYKLLIDVKDDLIQQATRNVKILEEKIKRVKIDAYFVLKVEDRDLNILQDEIRRLKDQEWGLYRKLLRKEDGEKIKTIEELLAENYRLKTKIQDADIEGIRQQELMDNYKAAPWDLFQGWRSISERKWVSKTRECKNKIGEGSSREA